MKSIYYFILFVCLFCYSCKDDNSNDGSVPYDPNKAVEIQSFYPLVGGMATRMILKGENFGNNPSLVKVYFNQKRAPVIGVNKGKILAITPQQPGDTCAISVVIGKDSLCYDEKFIYITTSVVTTVVGIPETKAFQEGSFSEATFGGVITDINNRGPVYLTVDDQYNLFLANQGNKADNPNAVILIDQQNRMVWKLFSAPDKPNAPSITDEGVVLVPADGGGGGNFKDTYFEFDPKEKWTGRISRISHPTPAQQAEGISDFTLNAFKHSFAFCPYDGMIYYRSNRDGYLIKFNPVTGLGQSVVINGVKQICNPANSDTYLVFDRKVPTRMYCSSPGQHCIYSFDILTGETEVYAGVLGKAGWRDGDKKEAQFNNPRQMVMDINNNLVVADANNHCIRRISSDGMVSTVVGIPGKKGYQDGNPADALFNTPFGLTIDKDYTIYIADSGNQCIRKLIIQ